MNQIIVQYNSFIPGLVEKMRMQLCLQDWEATLETSQRYSLAALQMFRGSRDNLRIIVHVYQQKHML